MRKKSFTLSISCLHLLERNFSSPVLVLCDWELTPPEGEGGDLLVLCWSFFFFCLSTVHSWRKAMPYLGFPNLCIVSPVQPELYKNWFETVCALRSILWWLWFAIRHLVSSFPFSFGLWKHLTKLIVSNAGNKWSNTLFFLYLCCDTWYLTVALRRAAFNIFQDLNLCSFCS